MNNFKLFKRCIAFMLCIALALGMVVPGALATNGSKGKNLNDRIIDAIQKGNEGIGLDPNEEIRVSIVLEKASTLEAGYSTVDIANNKSAMSYRDSLRAEQAAVQTAIERKLNKELDVVWNLTLAANIISANVRRGDIAAIKAVDGVESVYVERQYSPDVISIGGTADPNMAVAGMIDGAHAAWDAGYKGEGALIAIIDTGLDINHQSFNNGAFLAAINKDNLKLDEDTVLKFASELNAVKSEKATAEQLYRSEKIPFGWNYIDSSSDITHDNDTAGEHGSHVAGIAAANRLVDTDGDGVYEDALEAVKVAGNAPDAQIMVLKVFGKAGGAYDADCIAAIEDAIYLGADAVNLSLGRALPGFASPQGGDPYADIQEILVNSDTVVVYSAGNAGSWANNTAQGYLYNDGVNYQLDGESGSYTNSFTVASVDNGGFIGATAEVNGHEFGWTDGSVGPEFRTLDPDGKGTTFTLIMVDPDSAGNDDAIVAALADEIKGAIYMTWRGVTSFYVKGNAGAGAGAAAVIVANNQPGTIRMDLTGYTGSVPCVSILQDNGLAIWDSVSEKKTVPGTSFEYITTTITVNGKVGAHTYSTDYYTMSDFSSWGTTGDLALKPEISAFGGSIYSVWGSNKSSDSPQTAHDQYELMSGTSMAAPQITGMSALVQQYLRDKGYDFGDTTTRAITQGLLMAAAQPMKDADGNYYSLLQQGAGLANVNNAVSSPVYITVKGQNDGKVKAELGDDYGRSGEYIVEFDIHNLTGEAYTYELDLAAFTQAYFEETGYGKFLDYATRALDVDVQYEIDGELFTTEPDLRYDFDDDGDIDDDDAQLLLDYIIKGTALIANAENADVNGDGVVDTYDVHVLLNTDLPEIKIGKETVHVKVTISLTDEEKATLDEQNPGGAYVESYIFVQPVADDEGALAPELSIPVLAYYGSWTDASMYEVGSAEDWYNRTNNGLVGGRYPYTYQGAFSSTYNLTMTNVLYTGAASTSISKNNVLLNGADAGLNMGTMAYRYTPIRNYGNGVVQITDNNGNVLWRSADFGASYGVTYYENAGFWVNPDINGSLYYALFNDVSIDWASAIRKAGPDVSELTVSLILAPEYYAQYDYDWDILTDKNPDNGELGDGAILSTTLKLDQEPPVIENITVVGDDPASRTIVVDLTDNKSLSEAKLYDESNNPNNFTAAVRQTGYERMAASGTSATVTFKGGRVTFGSNVLTPGYLYDAIYRLEVTDTSGNLTVQRFKVGNVDFTEVPETVTPSEYSIEMVNGSTYALSAEVGPYNLTDEAKAVTWSSADESIVTVDDNGVVTAVSRGTTTVTVSTVYNGADGKPVTAEVTVEVFTLPITATGILGDADGYAKFFTWDFEEGILSYSDAEESETVYPQALTPYTEGTFLVVDGDGTIYQLDADGNVLKSSAEVYDGLLPYDMAYTDDAGFWWTVQGYLLSEPDPMNPEMYGFNLSTYGTFIGLAIDDEMSFDTVYQGQQIHIDRTIYLLTTDNVIYEIYLYNGDQNALISTNETDLTAEWVGYAGESYSNMVVGSDGNLYVSIMTGDTNEVYQLSYWETDSEWGYTALNLGTFGEGVWPGLFLTVENNPTDVLYDFNNDGVTDAADAQVLLRAVVRETATDDMDVNKDGIINTRDVYDLLVMIDDGDIHSVTVPSAAKVSSISNAGKAAKVSVGTQKAAGTVNSIGSGDAAVDSKLHTVTVPVKASDVNNGLLALSYDADVLTYASNKATSSVYTHVYAKDNVIRIGFAGLKALAADTVVAEITFTYEAASDNRETDVTISIIEDGTTYNETPETETVSVKLAGEDLPSYILTGVLTDDSFNAQYFTWDTAGELEYTNTLPGYPMNPVVAANVSDSEYYIINYDPLNDKYDMYLVSKEDGKILSSVENWGVAGEDVIPWDMAYGGDDFYGMWGVYGYYIFTNVDTETPMAEQQLSAWNFQSYNTPYFLGIDVVEEAWSVNGNSGDAYILAIDDSNYIWKLMPYETANGTSASFQRIPYTGMPDLYNDLVWATDDATGTSLVVGDDGALYFSYINPDSEATSIYRLTLNDAGTQYEGELIAETEYWIYPALLLGASVAEKTPDVPDVLTFDGILSDNGDGKFFTWDGETKLGNNADVAPIGISKTVNNDGYYVISESDGMLYRLDNNGKTVGNGTDVSEAVWDVAETKVGIFGVYGNYLIAPFQPDTFALSGFDLTQFDEYVSYFAAIAAVEQPWTVETTTGLTYEGDIMLYLLDDYGWVWPIYVRESNGEFAGIIVGEYSNNLYTSLRVEPKPYGGSTLIVGDENTLYASVLVGSTNNLYQINMDHDELECTTTKLGELGYAGLITDVKVPAANGTGSVHYVSDNVQVLDTAAAVNVKEVKAVSARTASMALTSLASSTSVARVNDKVAVLACKNAPKSMTLKGGLNSIEIPVSEDADDVYPKTTVTVPVNASESTNGEFVLKYDANVLKLDSVDFGAMFTSYEAEDGSIHVGYAAKEAVNAIVLNAVFSVIDSEATTTTVTLEVIQDGEDKTGSTTEFEIELNHEWREPEFTWAEDGKSATAAFTCDIDDTHTATVNATVTSTVKTPATCETKGTTTYTATVEFNGKNYTDTKDVEDIAATGHKWGEAKFTWSEDGKSATATFTCENDSAHTETVTATVTSAVKTEATCETKGTTTYTATVEYNGKSYTDTKDVEDIAALGHDFTVENADESTLRTPADHHEAATYWYTCSRCGTVSDTEWFSHGETLPYEVVVDGDDDTWNPDSGEGLTFTSDGDHTFFSGIKVDGVEIPEDAYTVNEETMAITLTPEFLATLEEGEHTLTIVYNDGEASTSFNVGAKADEPSDPTPGNPGNPTTGEGANAVWLAIVGTGIMGLAIVAVIALSKKGKKENA